MLRLRAGRVCGRSLERMAFLGRDGVDEQGEAVVEQLLPGKDDVPQLEELEKK